jgi:uncharacterized tellurite resistance protein B-like protein
MPGLFSRSPERGESTGSRGKEPGDDVRIAACALLVEMAEIDGEFSDEERARIVSIIREEYGLPEDRVDALIAEARSELESSIDLWRFTHRINETYQEEEKVRIIELVWRVVYADGRLEEHEDYLVHKLSKLLDLSHRQLISAKMKALHGGP